MGEADSYRSEDRGGQSETGVNGTGPISDEEIERAIVRAVTLGAVDVARTLAAQLEARSSGRPCQRTLWTSTRDDEESEHEAFHPSAYGV